MYDDPNTIEVEPAPLSDNNMINRDELVALKEMLNKLAANDKDRLVKDLDLLRLNIHKLWIKINDINDVGEMTKESWDIIIQFICSIREDIVEMNKLYGSAELLER